MNRGPVTPRSTAEPRVASPSSGAAARRWLVAAMAALLVVLAGCGGGLPTNANPQAGEPVLGQERQVIQVRPQGPSADATPEQIVRGFLLANVSFADSHEVARTYLTSALASSWVPTSQILIYPRDYDLTSVGDDGIEANVPVQGMLDGDGRLTQLPADSTRTQRFGLTQVDGQWRINSFPDDFGLWLSVNAFEAQYRTASINYLAPTQEEFVPETRWFSRDEGLPTALARALLAPVPAYLAEAVRTGVSNETNLVAGAVPVDPATGTATVNLQGAGLTEDPSQVRALYAQFFATLSQAAGVRDVELQINGQALSAPGVTGPVSSLSQLGMSDPDPPPGFAVLRVGPTLTPVDPGNYALRDLPRDELPDPAMDLPQVSSRWVDLAISGAAEQFAAVDVDRGILWRRIGEEQVERSDIGEGLSAPVFDGAGTLWVAGRSSSLPRVWAIDTQDSITALARPVEAEWLEPQAHIESFDVSPDGQRALIVVRDRGEGSPPEASDGPVSDGPVSEGSGGDGAASEDAVTTSLLLSGIVRDQQGRPTALTPPRPLAPTITSVVDASWASQESLVVLGRQQSDDQDHPYLLPIGGWLQPLTVEPGARTFIGMPTGESVKLAIITDDGRVHTREGEGWFPYRNGDDLIVPAG
ncbi:MAG: LpqB family beta-propeller domain-containing protein [Ornithinimicrobium sp.]